MRRLATLFFLASLGASRLPAVPRGEDDALLRAETLLEKKDYKKAEAALREVVASEPTNARAHGDLALALLSQGKTREAVDEARLAAAFGPETPEARYIYGLALKADRRPLEASRELEKAIALKPGPTPPLRALAEVYAEAGDGRAAETYARLIEREPAVVADRAALAEFLWASGQPARGNEVLEEALGRFPGDRDLQLRYGRALVEQERFLDGAQQL
ncbi:MAG: tetratricopeptide repeat protein, partial [Thermoanaerobaculia bacterium]